MVNRRNGAFWPFVMTSLFIVSAHAEPDHEHQDDELHTQEVHAHGAWELFAALDDRQLSVTVKGPLIDAVGFEHQPTDEEEFVAIRSLKDRLAEPKALFVINERARCTIAQPAEIVLPQGYEVEAKDGELEKPHEAHETDSDHDHDAHEDEDEHDDHKDHDGHDDHDNHSSDVEAVYVFNCESPARLKAITANGFDTFRTIESIEAVFLGNSVQKALRLTRNSKSLQID